MRKLLAAAVAIAATSAAFVAPVGATGKPTPPPPPPKATGTLTVVHGIPGKDGFPVTVDITNLRTGPVATDVPAVFTDNPVVPGLPVGRYRVDIKVGGQVALSAKTWLKPGDVDAVVAHLTEDGKPTISVFNTPTRWVKDNARVVVRHTAAAPAVDIWATAPDCAFPKGIQDLKIIANLANPNQARVDVPAGSYCVRVKAAGTFTEVLAAPFTLDKRTVYVVYAVGSLADGSFTPIVQAFPARS